MKKIKRYISNNWLWIVAGLLLTVPAVKMAYEQREYIAYGGEWLILPLILMGAELMNDIGEAIGYLLTWEEDDDDGRD
jgi:hypothetical protein